MDIEVKCWTKRRHCSSVFLKVVTSLSWFIPTAPLSPVCILATPVYQEVIPGSHLHIRRRLGQTAAINSSLYISWFRLCLIRHVVMWASGIPTLPIELVALAKVKYNILCANNWPAHAQPFAQQNMSPWMIVTLTCQNGQTDSVHLAHSCLAAYYGFSLSKLDPAIPTVAYLLLKTSTKILLTYSQLLANTQNHKNQAFVFFTIQMFVTVTVNLWCRLQNVCRLLGWKLRSIEMTE